MIPKIDTQDILSRQALSPFRTPGHKITTDFGSLLEKSLDNSSPLEASVIEWLIRTLEALLNQPLSEENDLSIHVPIVPRQLPSSPPLEIPKVSNNLHQPPDLESVVSDASRKYGVDRTLIKAVIEVESAGNPLAVSRAGAQGLMQLMPGTAADMNVADPFDPVQNVMGGTLYLQRLLDRYQGNVRLALSAYNWGMGNLERCPEALPKETRNYIAKIEKLLATS